MATEASKASARSAPAWPLLQFFLLAFALMWVCFFTVALAPIPAGTPLGQLLLLLGAFAPCVAALLVTARVEARLASELYRAASSNGVPQRTGTCSLPASPKSFPIFSFRRNHA